jgi:hypothetical protein
MTASSPCGSQVRRRRQVSDVCCALGDVRYATMSCSTWAWRSCKMTASSSCGSQVRHLFAGPACGGCGRELLAKWGYERDGGYLAVDASLSPFRNTTLLVTRVQSSGCALGLGRKLLAKRGYKHISASCWAICCHNAACNTVCNTFSIVQGVRWSWAVSCWASGATSALLLLDGRLAVIQLSQRYCNIFSNIQGVRWSWAVSCWASGATSALTS